MSKKVFETIYRFDPSVKLLELFELSISKPSNLLGHINDAFLPMELDKLVQGKGFWKDQSRHGLAMVAAAILPFTITLTTGAKIAELSSSAYRFYKNEKKIPRSIAEERQLELEKILKDFTKDTLLEFSKFLKIENRKNVSRLSLESKIILIFLLEKDHHRYDLSIKCLKKFKKEYENFLELTQKEINKTKKDRERKRDFLLNNLHLTNKEQEKALKTPYDQLHKIKKEYNIPLYSEVKDEIQKANAIAYKDSEEFENKIELMNKLDIRIPKRNVYKFATNTEIEKLNNKIYSFSKDVWSFEEYENYYSLINDFKLYKSDVKPIMDRKDSWIRHQKTLDEKAREEKRLIKQKARQEKIREHSKLSKGKSSASLPDKHNKKWTESDDIKLIEMINSKKSILDISDHFLRTERAILLRCINVHKIRYTKLEYLIDEEMKLNIQNYYLKYHKNLLPPSLKKDT